MNRIEALQRLHLPDEISIEDAEIEEALEYALFNIRADLLSRDPFPLLVRKRCERLNMLLETAVSLLPATPLANSPSPDSALKVFDSSRQQATIAEIKDAVEELLINPQTGPAFLFRQWNMVLANQRLALLNAATIPQCRAIIKSMEDALVGFAIAFKAQAHQAGIVEYKPLPRFTQEQKAAIYRLAENPEHWSPADRQHVQNAVNYYGRALR